MRLVLQDETNTKISVENDHVSLFVLLRHDYSLLLVIVVMIFVYGTKAYGGWSCCPTRSWPVQHYELSALCSGHFTLGERAGSTHRITSWVDPSACFDICEKEMSLALARKSATFGVFQPVV